MVNGQNIGHDHETLEFAHDQWSKLTNFDHLTTEILKFWPWSWSEMTNFDHLTTVISKFWPWSWSKIFGHLTMTPGLRPNGQKIMAVVKMDILWLNFVKLCSPFSVLTMEWPNFVIEFWFTILTMKN